MKKAFIKFIIFLSSICALSENPSTDNYFFIISCVLMIGWSLCSLFKSAIDYLSMEDTNDIYGRYYDKGDKTTYRKYTTKTSKEIIDKINKNLLPNTQTKLVLDNNNTNDNMTTVTDQNPTKVLSLLPIKEILRQSSNNPNPPTHSEFVSESTIIPLINVKEKEIEATTEEVIDKIEEPVKIKERTVVPIIMIQNEEKLSTDRVAVYKSIIDAFKAKNMSQSMTYTLLQSISAIDVYSDAITIYTNKLILFQEKIITEDELIASMKLTLHGEDLSIIIVERKDVSIADYYLKNSFY